MTATAPSDEQSSSDAAPAGDDFIPAPDEKASAPQGTDDPVTSSSTLSPSDLPPPVVIESGISQTGLIIAAAAFLILAGLLLLLRNSVRRSLISARATMDAANTASWIWYLVLLALGALVIAGVTAGLFSSMLYIGITLATAIIGIAVAASFTSRAKRQG